MIAWNIHGSNIAADRGMADAMLRVAIDPATPDERTLALLAHMLQIMLCWIAPLAIFLIKRQSKFVSFHALQAFASGRLHASRWQG